MKKLALVVMLCSASFADASILTDIQIGDEFLEVEYFAGSGPNTAYVVIDFAATGGDTYAFGYRYSDPSATGHDALLAIEAAGALEYEFTTTFGPPFTDNFGYLSESGATANFWSYSVGTHSTIPASVSWSNAATGSGERVLMDGAFDGWFNGFGLPPAFDAIPPAIPTAAAAGVPEPGTLTISLFGLFVCASSMWRRRNRHRP